MKSVGEYFIEDREKLGEGMFGTVCKGFLKADMTKSYAVKTINQKSLNQRLYNNLKNEISILAKINSPNVIKLIDIQRTHNNFYLIMELCNGGDLERLKEARGGRFTEIEARLILQQLVAGFKEIYKKQVMHRDLKLANILVHLPKTDMSKLNQLQGNAKKQAVN